MKKIAVSFRREIVNEILSERRNMYMNALTLVLFHCVFLQSAYRFYGLFIANKVLELNSERATPAVSMADGHDYVKTNKYVLFGHHFAAIAAAGPLLGPVLAAQFGYLPGALWIIIGCVLAGAVHDMIVLFASVRHKGQSLAKIAESEIGKTAGNGCFLCVSFYSYLNPGRPFHCCGKCHV